MGQPDDQAPKMGWRKMSFENHFLKFWQKFRLKMAILKIWGHFRAFASKGFWFVDDASTGIIDL